MPLKLISKPCRICGSPIKGVRRRDRKSFYYANQCPECRHRPRDREAMLERMRAATGGMKHPRAKPLGSTRIHTSRQGLVYRMVKTKERRPCWEYEHRVVMERFLGRKLSGSEHVHHLDGNTLNNIESNLRLFNDGDHTRHHHTLITWARKYSCCVVCGETSRRHASHGRCTRCTRCNQRKHKGLTFCGHRVYGLV